MSGEAARSEPAKGSATLLEAKPLEAERLEGFTELVEAKLLEAKPFGAQQKAV